MKTCDFAGCSSGVAFAWQPEQGLKLCQQHKEELDVIIESQDVSALMDFWARAEGHADFDGMLTELLAPVTRLLNAAEGEGDE